MNAREYNLDHAVISIKRDAARLLVTKGGKIIKNKELKNLRGAKISFSRTLNKKLNRANSVKAEWEKASFERLGD